MKCGRREHDECIKVRLVYLQLPYFTKEVDDCESIFEKLIFVLKHMDVLQRMPWLAQDAVFQKLASIADVASLNKQERLAYDENLRKYRDTIAVMEGQYLEGLEKGMEKGQLSEKKETAMRLRDMGLTIDQIAQGAGITVEEATKLLDK
jgi:predicted transposase/invertase (TIGR01784 family)